MVGTRPPSWSAPSAGRRLALVPDRTVPTWSYASLTLAQPRWPGTRGAEWVAATSRAEEFRTTDLHAALDRLGADGWELVTSMPEWADRPAGFYFKRPLT